MKYQAVFKRYEIKYLISREQKEAILDAMAPYMRLDEYGKSTIRNIYYDTDDYILARHSIARPDFKEKLRIRSYKKADEKSEVFVELKRKSDHIVYKRRMALPEADAMKWMAGDRSSDIESECHAASDQVTNEIEYFCSLYKGLRPTVFLSYDREAYKMNDGGDFRVTFDSNIRSRDYDISLESDAYGTSLLDDDKVLMELKCSGGIPLWMAEALSAGHIYKTSFSKYGTAYRTQIFPAVNEDALVRRSIRQAAELQAEGNKNAVAKGVRESGRLFAGWRQSATA